MKKIGIYILLFFILLLIVIMTIIHFNSSNVKVQNKDVISAYDEIFEIQKNVDIEIKKLSEDQQYTFENPKVILNPYKLAPLTALVIFYTPEETSVEVKINGNKVTNVEKEKKHMIPIYGMYENYENSIELILDNGSKKDITIKTEKYEGDPITVEKTCTEVENNLYFLSPNFVNNCIIDGKGNVVWYILGDYAGDIEYIGNGHFYISDPNQGKNGVKINYSSFLEMDYLGKIYKQWITKYGIHHELVPLSDEKMMVLGAKDDSDFFDSIIYIMDLKTSKIIKYIDLYEFLHNIDPELIESLGTDFDLVNNAADYDETTGELLISLRGLNSLMKLNFNTEEIEWIFGDPDFWGKKFEKYMLKVVDDTRYFGGQHTAFYTTDGLIGVHNNDIDQFDLSNSNLSHYLDRYSTCNLLKVDEQNKTIETVWEYTANKERFSNVGGHLQILENNNKLVTYGWAMKEEAYKNPDQVVYTDPVYKNGIVVQLNEKDEEIFRVKIPGLIYRTYKIDSLYKNEYKNYEIEEFKRIDGTEFFGRKINTSEIKKSLKEAEIFTDKVEITTNRVYISKKFEDEDEVDMIFIGENNETYIYSYKEKNKKSPESFNSGFASKQISLPQNKYEMFIKVNDKYYDTNMIVEF